MKQCGYGHAQSASAPRHSCSPNELVGSSRDDGRILEEAAPEAFFAQPQHPRAQQFLADLLRR